MSASTGAGGVAAAVAPLGPVVAALAARAAEHDRDGTFPHEGFDLLHAAGTLNLTVPVAAGGAGLGLEAACAAVEEVATGDPSVALCLSQHLLFHANLADPANRWPAAVRERVQRSSVDGVALINALRVEPELGTPARGGLPATVAERVPGGWRLTGRKIYATGIPRLRWMAVWARTDDPEPLVGTFLVEAGTPGYRVEATWDHLGMRATRSDDVVFEGVAIPEDHAVDIAPPAARATAPPPRTSAWNNLIISSVYLGVARSARDWLARYLHERVPANLGRPLASLPRFESAVGEIEASLAAAARLIRTTAADIDRSDHEVAGSAAAAIAESALVKLSATRASIAAVEAAAALVGNPGLSRGNPLERHYRDVLCSRIHSPQDDTIVAAAGRAALAAAAPVAIPVPSPAPS